MSAKPSRSSENGAGQPDSNPNCVPLAGAGELSGRECWTTHWSLVQFTNTISPVRPISPGAGGQSKYTPPQSQKTMYHTDEYLTGSENR